MSRPHKSPKPPITFVPPPAASEAVSMQPCELSVIVASHNRRELLQRCLDSLAAQTQDPATFEVIVADDGSSDGTARWPRPPGALPSCGCCSLEQAGHAAAQNARWSEAAGPVVPPPRRRRDRLPELVAAHIAGHRRRPMAIGVGALTQQPVAANDWYAHAFARGWNEHYEELAEREAHWTDCYGAQPFLPACRHPRDRRRLDRHPVRQGLRPGLRPAGGRLHSRLSTASARHPRRPEALRPHAHRRPAGGVDARRARRPVPRAGPELLDWKAGAGPRELALRRVLIALHLPLSPLAWLGALRARATAAR